MDPSPSPAADGSSSIEIEVRVRYPECDPIGVAHHSVYAVWMEIARTDLLRRQGTPYSELEKQGVFFVVARMTIRYRRPARYDDLLRVIATHQPGESIKVEHTYEIRRGSELLADASTTLVCVDREGRPRRIPEGIFTTSRDREEASP